MKLFRKIIRNKIVEGQITIEEVAEQLGVDLWAVSVTYFNTPLEDAFLSALMACDFDNQDSVDLFIDCQTVEEYDTFTELMLSA